MLLSLLLRPTNYVSTPEGSKGGFGIRGNARLTAKFRNLFPNPPSVKVRDKLLDL
jgi:hypothetical protein